MLTLEGAQGVGKSTGLEALVGAQWFADTGLRIGDKDSLQALRGKWLYEFGELDAFKGREATAIKAFVSARSDYYRPSYARRARDFKRQIVFAGTTNEHEYLPDRTGNRRFWPVTCHRVNVAAIRADRDQLWAEAFHLYRSGQAWHVDSAELGAVVAEQQAAREVGDDWDTLVSKWLRDPVRRPHEGVSTADAAQGALGLRSAELTKSASIRIGNVLRRLGYDRRQVRVGDERAWLYFPRVTNCDSEPPLGDTR
jgi:putative DNA primase/helicase